MVLTEIHPKNIQLPSRKTEKHPNLTLKSSNKTRIKTKNPPKWRILSPYNSKDSIKSTDNPMEIEGDWWVAGRFFS